MAKTKVKNREMTIEKLAQMSQGEFVAIRSEIREGFDVVDRRFNAVDNKFDALVEVLREMRDDIKEVKGGTLTIHEDYAELRARVERLEKKVSHLSR